MQLLNFLSIILDLRNQLNQAPAFSTDVSGTIGIMQLLTLLALNIAQDAHYCSF